MGFHFYTTNKLERDNAEKNLGAEDEGVLGYVAMQQANFGQCISTVPLYRLFKKTSGDHFYTTSSKEAVNAVNKIEYSPEMICCYLFVGQLLDPLDPTKSPQIYRFYDPKTGEHFYTANPQEAMKVQTQDFHREDLDGAYGDGVSAAMVFQSQAANTVPLYRLYFRNAPPAQMVTVPPRCQVVNGKLQCNFP